MKKVFIWFVMFAITAFMILQVVLYYNKSSCGPWGTPLTINTVNEGTFLEYVPQTGVVIRDSVTDSYFIQVEIDQLYLTRIAVGQKATSRFNNQNFNLMVSKVFPELHQGRFIIHLTSDSLRNPEGETVRLRIELSEPRIALLLAVGGFYKDSRGEWVFVVDGEKAIKRPVKLGRKNTEDFEVLEGLKPGDRVITSSYEGFSDHDSILLTEIEDLQSN